ncbi:ATP-binding protein [Novosphingobium sp. LASN5T]|uniref:ATP-binding protein n=1 Tax=Novosphingobium sp. LASN5T TaxID=2491021 RepID=UPI001CC1DC87|nr:ATP-binding protein [Novosphingobium sp. LASN5T]
MTMITKLRARVSPHAISKVTRIFNGTLDDIFNELFQNARRAGATRVTVTAEHMEDACLITVSDDGGGIADPVDLLSLGQSDWSDECRTREDPAGMGFFSLAGLDTVVSSRSADGAFSLAITGMPGPARPTSMCSRGMERPARPSLSGSIRSPMASSNAASRQPPGSCRSRSATMARISRGPISSPMRTRSSSGTASASACSVTGIHRISRRSISMGLPSNTPFRS